MVLKGQRCWNRLLSSHWLGPPRIIGGSLEGYCLWANRNTWRFVSDHYEKQDLLDSNPFNFSIINFVVHRFLSYILPRPFCFTWLFQFLCFLQQQKWVDSHCQWGNFSSRDSFFDAVRDNAVGSHKAVHIHSLQMFQNVL